MIKVVTVIEKYIDRIFIINNEYPFELYQYFKILDEKNNNPLCKVIRPHAIKKLSDIDNITILKNAISLGFSEFDKFYWAEVSVEKELIFSIDPDCECIKTEENEMYNHLYSESKNNCLILGEIRGTENLYKEAIDTKYKDILMMAENWKLIKQNCLPLIFEYKKLQQSPNIGIFGNSGSGKTFTLKTLIEELIKNEIPNIVFDPHNEFDFSEYMDSLPVKFKFKIEDRVKYYSAGKDFALDFTILSNEDFKYFIRNTTTLTEPQEFAIDIIREKNDTFLTFTNRVDKITNAFIKSEKKDKNNELTKDEITLLNNYCSKISNSSVLIALNSKLQMFERKNFFSGNYQNIINNLKDKKTIVIRGEHNIVAPMMGLIINDLWKKRKDYKDNLIEEEYPPLILSLDESHMYAPKDNNIKAPLKQSLIDISREGRKYGMFLICATQRISELNNTVLSQMSTKIILKTSQESDKQIIQKECGLNEIENNSLHLLDSGHGYIISPILKTKGAIAFKSRSNYTKPKSTENVFDELKNLKQSNTLDNLETFLISILPIKISSLSKISGDYEKLTGQHKNISEIQKVLIDLEKKGIVHKNSLATLWTK